jgi:hypothetical protein
VSRPAVIAGPQPSGRGRGVSAEASAVTGSRGLLATTAAAIESFFFDPALPEPAAEGARPMNVRPVVCVFGLARGCGVTVVARALAAELALRDPAATAVVCSNPRPAGIPLATHAASRLARLLEDVPGAAPRAVGRLCLAGGAAQGRFGGGHERLVETALYHAPVVLDAGCEVLGGARAAVADRVVMVTTRDVEPALARVASECVARIGPSPVVVLNRAPHDQPGLFALPNSPLGARLALGGREARGELGRTIAELADLLEDEQ